MRKKLLIITFVLALALIAVLPAAAQTPTPVSLDIDSTTLTNGLFQGANIMIAALGTIMFLLAGFKLGGNLLRSIVNAVSGRLF